MTITQLLPPATALARPLPTMPSRGAWLGAGAGPAPQRPWPGPAAAGSNLKVFVVVPAQPILRAGLATMLASDPGCHWVGEAANCVQAAELAPALMPDVLLVDADVAGSDPAVALAPLQARLPLTRLVLLASEKAPAPAAPCHGAVAASAWVPRDVSAGALVRALRAAPLPAGTTASCGGAAATPRTFTAVDLTPREITLLGLMGEGLSNADISTRLGIALPTVKFHVTNILSKMQTKNRTAAVLEALRLKLIGLEAGVCQRPG